MNNGKNAPSRADPDADTRMPKWATKLSIGWGEDCPLQLLHEVDSLQPGVAQNRKTPGVLIVEGNKKPVKWAVSGHSMPDPAATTKVLSNRFWTSTVKRFCRRIRHKLPSYYYDKSGTRHGHPEAIGRYYASHAEKQLAVFLLVKTLKRVYGRVRFSDMKDLAKKKTKKAYILLGHQHACGNCLAFLGKIKQVSGLDITALPCQVKHPYRRPPQTPYHLDANGDGGEDNSEDERNAQQRQHGRRKQVEAPPLAEPTRGEGSPPANWHNGKPLPPTVEQDWNASESAALGREDGSLRRDEKRDREAHLPGHGAGASRVPQPTGLPASKRSTQDQTNTSAPPSARHHSPVSKSLSRVGLPPTGHAPAKRQVRMQSTKAKPYTSMWEGQITRRDEGQTGGSVPGAAAGTPSTSAFPDLSGFRYGEKHR